MDKYKELAIAAAEDCGFGVCCPSDYFAVNEQTIDGIPVQTLFCVNKDVIDEKELYAIYSIPEIAGGDTISCGEWEYTETLSINELAEKIREVATAISEAEYREMLSYYFTSQYKQLAKSASDCGFGVDEHSEYFSVNERNIDGDEVQTAFCVNKDTIDGNEVFCIYYVPEYVDGDDIGEHDWLYTKTLSVDELAEKIREVAMVFSEDDYRKMLAS